MHEKTDSEEEEVLLLCGDDEIQHEISNLPLHEVEHGQVHGRGDARQLGVRQTLHDGVSLEDLLLLRDGPPGQELQWMEMRLEGEDVCNE